MQEGQSFVYPQKVVLDNALESTIKLMKKRLADMDAEVKRLRAENERQAPKIYRRKHSPRETS